MPTVARFNLTPVKSTSLQHPQEVFLGERGVDADRRFLFLDADGRRVSDGAKAPLLGILAQYDQGLERLALRFPDGTECEGDACALGEPMTVALYDRTVTARRVLGPFSEAVSAHAGRDLRLARVEPPGSAGGSHRVSIVSVGSVGDVGHRGGRDGLDSRRFRMLVEVDGCDPYEEDAWSGRRVRLGDAVVLVGDSIPRCVVTTMDPDSGRPDFPTLDVLAGHRRREGGLMLGVYGDVERPGTVRVGDPVEPLA
jgi:uncharacterized protein YcbX